jgi:hypothetical protein
MTIIMNAAGHVVGATSWTTGFRSAQPPREDLHREAHRNLEAVINRLFRQGRDDEAEELFNEFA